MFQFPIITGYMTGLMTGHFAPDTAELINRARADLRMGVPVVLCGHGSAALVLAAETMGPARLATLRALGGAPVLAITGRRAEALKAGPYDGDVARLPLPEEADCAWIRAIADPADDLRTPMKGPLFALREGDAALHRLAVSLVKSAQLLPAAVVIPVGHFLRGAAEGHGGEEGIARVLADEVVVGGVIHVGLPRGHGVEHFQRAHKLARCLLVDGQAAVGDLVDIVDEIAGRIVQHGKPARPGRDHGQRAV